MGGSTEVLPTLASQGTVETVKPPLSLKYTENNSLNVCAKAPIFYKPALVREPKSTLHVATISIRLIIQHELMPLAQVRVWIFFRLPRACALGYHKPPAQARVLFRGSDGR